MVEFFFTCNSSFMSTDAMMLLSGPPSSGKTSLLFQFAFNCALQNTGDVVFICSKQRLEAKPPFLSKGTDPDSEVFRRVHMKYIKDDEGIKKYFAAFHLHDNIPSTVIIDGFGDFFVESNCQNRYSNPRGRDLAMSRSLALCRDAIHHANERLSSMRSCKLLLSDTHQGDNPRLLFIYKRWISSIFVISKGNYDSFLLKESNRMKSAKYSISLQSLVLEEIIDE
ncbi:hypothetical protein ZOSMA_89G00610 [Zostera marina]|uniref:Uncharacterized protein n=1 Tax=Zostera marina TaxID=29655 RepID=A0A0K9NKI7_ZOSMR|nr:hypothetical protein ZOSMA_89G00610 [Zostera marina]